MDQDKIKAFWFDQVSTLVMQNMALTKELAELRQQRMNGGADPGARYAQQQPGNLTGATFTQGATQ